MTASPTVTREKKPTTSAAAVDMPELLQIPIERIFPGPNVRTDVGDLDELEASIEQLGILQPIDVVATGDTYELTWGQRRLAAAKLAGLTHVPAVVHQVAPSAETRSIQQLVENLQRRDLNPLEEAKAFRVLLDANAQLTQAELAKRIGRSAPYVSNALRILELERAVSTMVADGRLSGTHARALAGLKGKAQVEAAEWAVSTKASTHALEEHLKWERDLQERGKKQRATQLKVATEAEAKLVELGARKDSSTIASAGYYSQEVVKVLKGRGWRTEGMGSKRGKTCDCEAFAIDLTYNGNLSKITPTCVSSKHQEATRKEEQAAWEEKQKRDAARMAAEDAEAERRRAPLAAYLGTDAPAAQRLTLFALVSQDYATRSRFVDRRKIKLHYERPMAMLWAGVVKIPVAQLAGEITAVVADHLLHMRKGDGILEAIAKIPEAQPAPNAKGKKAATS